MSSALSVWKRFVFLGLVTGIATAVLAENTYVPQGGEYPIAGYLPGDQVYPQISLGTNGGYVVWQDNMTDGDGMGISARRINANFLPYFGVFRVNEHAAGEQENVRVALLRDGGAVFVWQGGSPGFQHVYARFLKGDGTFATGDRLVNTYNNNHQIDPAVAVLSNGNVVVTWSSYGQDGSMYGVYSQMFSPNGDPRGTEFQINESTSLSQRSPSVAALSDGGFALVWVTERPKTTPLSPAGLIIVTNPVPPRYSADIIGRVYDADGAARGGEFRISADDDPCANPAISASPNGGFAVAWGQRDGLVFTNTWDIFARSYRADGLPLNARERLNTYTFGDQIAPRIASLGSDYLVVWTSIGQDGSREEIYGRFLSSAGSPVGNEIRVNTTTVSQQIHPAVASDGSSRFLVVWTSFIGGNTSFDLFAQRYAASPSLPAPAAPFVYAPFVLDDNGIYLPQLQASWPAVEGLSVANYEIYVDAPATPTAITATNIWTLSDISPSSTHRLQIAYVTTDGHHSPLSPQAIGTTWSGASYGGIPFEWMTANFGSDVLAWPKPGDDSDGDGASNLHEFLAGTAPQDPSSVMRVQLVSTAQGTRLTWNGQPGSIYQVQTSDSLNAGSWTNFGPPRFAVGTNDSVLAGGAAASVYYRVVRLR